jgi:hypothetical protein
MACGTIDGTTAYLESTAAGKMIWAWNIALADVAIFDYVFSIADANEMYAARAVW